MSAKRANKCGSETARNNQNVFSSALVRDAKGKPSNMTIMTWEWWQSHHIKIRTAKALSGCRAPGIIPLRLWMEVQHAGAVCDNWGQG